MMIFAIVIAMMASIAIHQEARAQNDDESVILSMTEFTVKQGHNRQFRSGIEAWKKCYIENEGDWYWNLWSRVQGEGNVYVLTSVMLNWAEMDEGPDEAARECRDIARDLINPNVERAQYNLARTIPEFSKDSWTSMNVLWVSYWQINNYRQFNETVRTVVETISEVEGQPRGHWYRVLGGSPDAPHFFAATSFDNFAALDEPTDGVWTVVENAHGADKRNELQEAYRSSVDKSWSYIFRHVEDLSRMPED